MKRIAWIVVGVIVIGCGKIPEPGETEFTGSRAVAVESPPTEEFEPAPALAPVRPLHEHYDPLPSSAVPPPVPPNHPRSTEEKLASPTWPEQLAAKQPVKEEAQAEAARAPAPVPTAAPGMEERQRRFAESVRERSGELDSLDEAARNRVYDEMKWKELGE